MGVPISLVGSYRAASLRELVCRLRLLQLRKFFHLTITARTAAAAKLVVDRVLTLLIALGRGHSCP